MGIYVYKVLKQSVELENGERAHLAVFAYKDSWWADEQRHHFLSGAARCDRAAEDGERGLWIVRAYKNDDGRITLNPKAYKTREPVGSFTEEIPGQIDSAYVDRSKVGKKMDFFKEWI